METKSSSVDPGKPIQEWLRAGCLPESAIPQLVSKLTPELACTTLLDAVFARGHFRNWHMDPPDFGDFHWSEVGGADDMVYDCVEEEEVWDQVDPLDRCIYGDEEAESRAADHIMQERYGKAERKMSRLNSAKEKTLARARAQKLLTAWLKTEGPSAGCGDSEKIQRIAMSLFPDAARSVKSWLSGKKEKGEKTRIDLLNDLVTSACEENESIKRAVLCELYVFLVVYELFVDLREFRSEPQEPEDITLPIWATLTKSQAYDDCWWDNCGKDEIMESVPWKGRGLLAKTSLQLHALVCSLNLANNPSTKYTSNSYGYMEVWTDVMGHIDDHPLGLEAALHFIEALVAFLPIDTNIYESQWDDVEETILPKLKELWGKLDVAEKPPADEQDHIQELLQKAKEFHGGNRATLEKVCQTLSEAASQPLKCVQDPATSLSGCISRIEKWRKDKSEEGPCSGVTRMRLSGNHSKQYLLSAALQCPKVKLLDLEDCFNLDEEILGAMTDVCRDANRVLLRGTNIPKSSPVVARLLKQGRIVDFSGQCCQSCGFHDTERPPKRRRYFSPKKVASDD